MQFRCIRPATRSSFAFAAFGLLAIALGAHADAPQGGVAAAEEAAARNQAALRQYTWIQTTQISLKGEVKATKVESVLYGPDGQQQKTVISAPQPKQEPGLRGRIQEHEEDELKNTLESAALLVQSYVPPSPEKLQASAGAGNMQILTAQPGQAILAFSNYQLPGDSMTLTMNLEPRVIQTIDVSTWMGGPDKPVTLVVNMQQLPDGTNYPQLSTLTIPSSNVQVAVNNSDFQKVGM
jgi:hypothetical protein